MNEKLSIEDSIKMKKNDIEILTDFLCDATEETNKINYSSYSSEEGTSLSFLISRDNDEKNANLTIALSCAPNLSGCLFFLSSEDKNGVSTSLFILTEISKNKEITNSILNAFKENKVPNLNNFLSFATNDTVFDLTVYKRYETTTESFNFAAAKELQKATQNDIMKAIDNSEINVKMEQESSFSHHQSSRHFINDIDFKTSHINNALEQKNSGLIGSSSGALGIVAGVGAVLGIGSVIAGLLLYNKKKNTKVSYKEVRQDDPQSDLPLSIIASKSCNSVYKDTVVKV